MQLAKEQLAQYGKQGFLLIPNLFSKLEVQYLHEQFRKLSEQDHPGRVLEKDNVTVRALHGCHLRNRVFSKLTLLPRMLTPAMQIIGNDVYVYQFKINLKQAFSGDAWPWHQDFIFWREEDGMQTPSVVNLVIFLDDVSEFNGPMFVIPKSHHKGCIGVSTAACNDNWQANFSADLKYSLDNETVRHLVNDHGVVSPKGPAGSVLFFDSNLVHGSPQNISPFSRRLLFVTYNSVANIPHRFTSQRPDFIVGRNFSPLKPVVADQLLGWEYDESVSSVLEDLDPVT
jgi:ectoine hydroxylase